MNLARFLLACACALTLLACGPSGRALQPAGEPSTASAEEEGIVSAKLSGPGDGWKLTEVEVENAKLVSRDGDAPLALRFERSKPKQGETTVEGADEPIRVTITYVDRKSGEQGRIVYLIDAAPDAKPGQNIPVSVAP
jgi:hypothetical protein